MATITTATQDPPLRDKLIDAVGKLSRSLASWLFVVQNQSQLKVVDTSGGGYAETVPPAGLNTSTGRSNQNQRITYFKKSADANTFTLNGVFLGPFTLTTQGQCLTIQSDGTTWYKVG